MFHRFFSLLNTNTPPTKPLSIKYVNYNCPICMKDKSAIPNAGGRFFLIDENRCVCNGCNRIFDKKQFYPLSVRSATHVIRLSERNAL